MQTTLFITRNDLPRIIGKVSGQLQRDILRVAADEFRRITWQNFGVTGVNRPHPWVPLSESYKKQLRRRSFGGALVPTLLRSGTLMNSIRLEVGSNYSRVYTDNPYAEVHQEGSVRKNIPARPYFPVIYAGIRGGFQLTPYAQARIDARISSEALKIEA